MIKTLLIDDDIEMLQGLTNIINWEEYGFTVTAKAKSGYEALNIISETMVDVIITDITMPEMNGLELIREAKKYKPDIKSVIISCHEDFNYAKEAIRLEADEYILKYTLTEEILVNVITKLKIKIQSERKQRENLMKANQELNVNKYVIIEKFYTDIIESNIPKGDEIYSRAALSNIILPSGNFRIISFFADNLDEVLKQCPIQEYNLFKFCILNIIEESIKDKENINVFPYYGNAFALLYWDNTSDVEIKQKIISMVKEIQNNVQMVLKFKISICFSGVYGNISDLKKATEETEAIRQVYFYKGAGEIVIANKEYTNKDTNELYKEFGPRLKGVLSMHKQNELVECMNDLFDRIAADAYSPVSVRTMLRRLLVDLEVTFVKYDISLEDFQVKGDTFLMYRKIVREALELLFEKLSESNDMISRPEIRKVIAYIETHLNEEISCDGMANFVNMNSNYFSRLFKNEVGVSFSDYLMNKRIEVATKLLHNSDFSIEEIIRAIGIESISYFYRAYKKITGNTPGEIRSKSTMLLKS